MKNKRLLICTIGGLVSALICIIGGLLTGNIAEFTFFAVAGVFVNRLMLGFIIGISRLKMNYLLFRLQLGLCLS
jgi:ABC-type amino acid transport system permease subunit